MECFDLLFLTPKQDESKNFGGLLSLSQRRKNSPDYDNHTENPAIVLSLSEFNRRKIETADINSSDDENHVVKKETIENNNENIEPKKLPIIKLRNINELLEVKGSESVNKLKSKPEMANSDDITIISSDDEKPCPATVKKKNKKKSNRPATEKKPKLSDDELMIKEKLIKTEKKRKLTNSTNLKTFPEKYQPENQKRVTDFFTVTVDPNAVRYFDTSETSKPSEFQKQPSDFLDVVINDIERLKRNNKSPHTIVDIIDLIEQDEEETTSKTDCLKVDEMVCETQNLSQNSSGKRTSQTDNSSQSVDKFFPIKKRCQNKSKNSKGTEDAALIVTTEVKEPENNCEITKFHPRIQNLKSCKSKSSFTTGNLCSSISNNSDDSSLVLVHKSIPSERTDSIDYPVKDSGNELKMPRRNPKRVIRSTSSTSADKKLENIVTKRRARKRLSFKQDFSGMQKTIGEENSLDDFDLQLSEKSTVTKKQRKNVSNSTNQSTNSTEGTSVDPSKAKLFENILEEIDLTTENTPKQNSNFLSKSVIKNIHTPALNQTISKKARTSVKRTKRKFIQCPDYKIVEGTTFAVDAFRFGDIEGVTHYFLTHFHADHYIGLKKSFCKPLFLSEITANLVESFIHTSREYFNVMQLHEPVIINDIEVTAIDANHCPGAVMFLFKFSSGMCTLHTGDFRASACMEEGPIFWNSFIHTIYLDTTYLSSKYAFKPQEDSIDDAVQCVKEFRLKHIGMKILYVCGTYVIGKEKIWTTIAKQFKFKVWTDKNRKKSLDAIGDKNMLEYLVDNPKLADLHVLSMVQLNYNALVEYMDNFTDEFDIVLAIRPSGWEKNSKPQFRGKINIVGIEYSEHSSYDELRRFVRFLQPKKIISTVPQGYDLSKTTKVPSNWYNNEPKPVKISYQTSITTYGKFTTSKGRSDNNKNISNTSLTDLDNGRLLDGSENFERLDATQSVNGDNESKKIDGKLMNYMSTDKNEIEKGRILGENSVRNLSEPGSDWMS